jgi:TetR/AcrR family transcriptional regulator, regulator of cefoperazone and chloramphenicol sensitivity
MTAKRKDGQETRARLLKAAGELFAQRGYGETNVAAISHRAGSNVAAINYHFGGKEALYQAVWCGAFEEAMRVYPPDGGLGPDAPAEAQLRAMIHSYLHRIFDQGRLGYAGKILLDEMSRPTGALEQIRRDALRPFCDRVRQVIRMLLGLEVDEQKAVFCEMSVIHQCLAIGFRRGKCSTEFFNGKPPKEFIDSLVDHITRFSLAGIAAVKAK